MPVCPKCTRRAPATVSMCRCGHAFDPVEETPAAANVSSLYEPEPRKSPPMFVMDVCDPSIAPGVGTPVKGGLDYREAHLLMEMIADTGRLTSLDFVEVNPTLDVRNATAQLGMELALSALGKKIL